MMYDASAPLLVPVIVFCKGTPKPLVASDAL